ncbi:unnamed protein product [Closterium sp. Naga37s-1]|nr:unnamed protein product [Closterium sp. Naga37s-1]
MLACIDKPATYIPPLIPLQSATVGMWRCLIFIHTSALPSPQHMYCTGGSSIHTTAMRTTHPHAMPLALPLPPSSPPLVGGQRKRQPSDGQPAAAHLPRQLTPHFVPSYFSDSPIYFHQPGNHNPPFSQLLPFLPLPLPPSSPLPSLFLLYLANPSCPSSRRSPPIPSPTPLTASSIPLPPLLVPPLLFPPSPPLFRSSPPPPFHTPLPLRPIPQQYSTATCHTAPNKWT